MLFLYVYQHLSNEIKYLFIVYLFIFQFLTRKCCGWLANSYHLTYEVLIMIDLFLSHQIFALTTGSEK